MEKLKSALDWILPLLKSRAIPFHVTGGFAAHLYGARRAVNDIDIDLPLSALMPLMKELQPHVEMPLQRYRDSTWDLMGTTLNFEGQLIDLTAEQGALVHDKVTRRWEPLEMAFDRAVWLDAFDHRIPVQNPHDLISYKLKIEYDQHKHLSDIEAVRRYLSREPGKIPHPPLPT